MAEERLSAFRWRIKLVPILTASSTHTEPKHYPHTCPSRLNQPDPPAPFIPCWLSIAGPHRSTPPDRTGVLSNHEVGAAVSVVFFCMFVHSSDMCLCAITSIFRDPSVVIFRVYTRFYCALAAVRTDGELDSNRIKIKLDNQQKIDHFFPFVYLINTHGMLYLGSDDVYWIWKNLFNTLD